MSPKNDDSFMAIAGLITVVVLVWWAGKMVLKILIPIAYCFGSFLPLVFFYAVPFTVVSIVVGCLLAFVSRFDGSRGLDYRALAIAFPVLCGLALLILGPRKQRLVHTIEKGKAVKTEVVVESVPIYSAFKRFQQGLGLEGKFDWEVTSYDLRDFALVVWFSILLGGPGIFLWFAIRQKHEEDERIRQLLVVPLQERIAEKEKQIDAEIHGHFHLQCELKERDQEIERLKAREDFLSKKEQTPAEPAAPSKPTGVMDGDDL